MTALGDRARDFLDVQFGAHGALDLTDAVAIARARLILGDLSRLDEREYSRDELGRFSSTGEASSHADEHAELARAAAIGTAAPSARSRARKAAERASLARVAHEHDDLAGAARHALAAQKHAEEAVRHSGHSEWTARERAAALRGVAAAKTSAEAAEAHMHAARTFGITEAAGRKHLAEAQRRRQAANAGEAADARTLEEQGGGHRVGVGVRIRGGGEEASDTPVVQEPSRQMRVGVTPVEEDPDAKPPPAPEPERKTPPVVPVGPGDRRIEFGYTHRRREPERPPPSRRHFSDVDRDDPARDRAARAVSLPPPPKSGGSGLLARLFRRDSVDYVRAWLSDRFRADLADVPDTVVLARARVILRVPRQASTGATLVEVLAAISRYSSSG